MTEFAFTPPRLAILDLPPHAPRNLRLLILLADTPLPAVVKRSGDYHQIFTSLLRSSIEVAKSEQGAERSANGVAEPKTLEVQSYDVVRDEYPSEEEVKGADGVLITGSAASAYEPLPWITTLVSFTTSLPSLNPFLKLIGICFGHQIIARAFGSTVERNEKGWEIGTRRIGLSERGREVFEGRGEIAVHQMHRDHVPSFPPSFELLGSTPACAIHGMVRLVDPSAPFSHTNIAAVTLQGHPEFDSEMVNTIIDAREAGGVISREVAEESREYAGERDDGAWIGRVLLRMFGV
ncbi:putative glutamine amidotransferase [Rhodotorula toruloides]|uniref:BY PROTMAP: gi/472584205/gb/EMS21811.1/ GMP synthase [Rhodosporidium toruloides NP11] gi/647394469/emb/CDR35699.1/ RHTO0S01e05160g1_1 [Rhodosporidium toruloides] n=1 Tax=Rhodotorula toruloides TaxID=5286 RepID=A0A0K3CL65_RHOTO|nr:putative glutamine amidotransferase [Rhodotorula toruloides]PRQ72117.1 Class I glutamine amidotransferase-like protein [Rhodotorula toruloides]